MNRHDFLKGVHARYQPRSYLEIGVKNGRSLALSRVPSVGIDPAFAISFELECDVRLVRDTSDNFFAREDPVGHLPHKRVDFGFIDGMHLFEYAFRDFINVEALSHPGSVVILDDMLPRSVDEAARGGKGSGSWAGDVYKVGLVLAKHRPDLLCVPVDTLPTGTLLVLGVDPSNTTLRDNYDAIEAEFAADDPQDVPAEILERSQARDPEALLASPVWDKLRALCDAGASTAEVREMLAGLALPAPVEQSIIKSEGGAPKPAKPKKKAPPARKQGSGRRGLLRRR
ncbi:MAG TPA: class I SAM-dependent methyltransferase [Mycobacteriales bacterium]|nr:class I SAM-dependent methyltransferase [Mycobacteriales bacterium]